MNTAKRTYTQRNRAATAAQTKARILAAARELILSPEHSFGVDEVARQAAVAVQTVYDHFGSKGGLLLATIGEVQREVGLERAFERVFRSRDGEEALQRMLGATVAFWHAAWPYVEFTVRARRTDPVVAGGMDEIDTLRHSHLWAICRRLEDEGRIRDGRPAAWAADQVFALTVPSVYEELVVRRGWSAAAATRALKHAVLGAVIEPGTEAVRAPAPDWSLLQEAGRDRAMRAGADPSVLSGGQRRPPFGERR